MRKIIILFSLAIFTSFWLPAQKVGLVLSGGGTDALAHIGVIKALEENNIRIDYITGTSMGAMIGALYASGVSIEQIEQYFVSRYFLDISTGKIPEKFYYFYPHPDPSPSMISLRFKKSQKGYSILLPSQVISSEAMDFEAVKFLAEAEKLAKYNFDSLMIPFRCVAADLVTKELVVFKDGSLTEALRASMSYPFFMRPIKINGHLMYDGGIYNNFPVDIMCSDFKPDYIIGSNVSQNVGAPDEDDLFSQLQNILIKPTDYSIYCIEGELIEPITDFGVFNFSHAQEAIDSGYVTALRQIKHIKYHIDSLNIDMASNHQDSTNIFLNKGNQIAIGDITFKGLNQKQATYAGSVLQHKKKKQQQIDLKTFERNYYRLFQESYIENLRTTLHYNPITKKYDARVEVEPIKSLTLDLGGNIASRPITTGYAGFSYNNLSTFGFKFGLNTHFGKMYQALNIYTRFDIPSKLPFYIMPKFVTHKWNWFESRQSNLFVSEKPIYIIEGETYAGAEFGTAMGNHLKLTGEVTYLQMNSDYYQTKNFSPTDTTDNTLFNSINNKITISSNSLNLKQYPYRGNSLIAQATYTVGNEYYHPGSTTPGNDESRTSHSFLQLRLDYQQYFRVNSKLRSGLTLSGAYSGMTFFKNYTSTVIQSPSFKPTPDSKTLFLESFHANKFIGVGGQLIFLPVKNFQIRTEAYIFQPYRAYKLDVDGQVAFGTPFADRFSILSAVIAYQTPFGPLSFSANYYYNEQTVSLEDEFPLTLLLNFGYIIFNKSGYHR